MAAKYLIFVDTNILLDFYRVRGRESGLSILKHIDNNLERFITTNQVEMEFKKNRQRVILEAHTTFKSPGFEGLQLPAFVSESKQSKALERTQKQLKGYANTLKTRMTRVLRNPTTHDPVFKTAQRLFRSDSDFNLTREKKIRLKIRALARNRFVLGYPPRKDGDTSIGDAINWEWIVHCAGESNCHVVVVTRDSDYGVTFDKHSILNDWLAAEFRDRVSQKRKLLLTDRLSTALKQASISVSPQEVAAEKALISRRRSAPKVINLMEALRRSLDQVKTPRRVDLEEYDPEPYEVDSDEPDFDERESDNPDRFDMMETEPPDLDEPERSDEPEDLSQYESGQDESGEESYEVSDEPAEEWERPDSGSTEGD